ncbi:hypothetical protein LEP1GSC116_3734 [Leptospira interrogans serovar Icterohaemorrhagiae str. Verdun HP]|uniref:Uncharacterized protein n=1 Tax=Leptospira interrogans serovar Icterohaemorrhagiae str. Verdun HP TaxID=1049910 RepID=M6RS97_LEPIR|nr:hypothetical protein LEP1GSC116_3734 [Leptospira interrogans serovar Icterohaemorrhagiae str. Verdun HP]
MRYNTKLALLNISFFSEKELGSNLYRLISKMWELLQIMIL